MENAIVAVTNNKTVERAKKFLVHLKVPFGLKSRVLADSVFYKDSLVMMEGVIAVETMRPTVIPEKWLRCSADRTKYDTSCATSVCVDGDYNNRIDGVEYGRTYTNIVVKEECVGGVFGLDTLGDLEPCWLITREEALKTANDLQVKYNAKTIERNTQDIGFIADRKRQTRAYEIWKKRNWFFRILMPLKLVNKNTPMIPEDRSWVIDEANKHGIHHNATVEGDE